MTERLRQLSRRILDHLDADRSGFGALNIFSRGDWHYGVTDTELNELLQDLNAELSVFSAEVEDEQAP